MKDILKNRSLALLFCLTTIVNFKVFGQTKASGNNEFIKVSKQFPRYFETQSGVPWIPIEINYTMSWGAKSTQQVYDKIEDFFKAFSNSGGNSVRIWGGPADFLEIEDKKIGVYNPIKFQHFDHILQLAQKYNIRIKFCLNVARNFNKSDNYFSKMLYSTFSGGPFSTFNQYIDTQLGRTYYLNRLKAYAARYKDNSTIYDWELWNEMNAISAGNWFSFTKDILDSAKLICPNQLSSQSLGSLDGDHAKNCELQLLTLRSDDIFCVHLYLDPAAQYPEVYGPLDISLSNAVNFMSNSSVIKPLFVNETGAVTAKHASPSPLYDADTSGIMLHDMLFAPFFSGAAGPGSVWFHQLYVDKYNLWYHYARFKRAVAGINPIAERFKPFILKEPNLNYYGLQGKRTIMMWCRDQNNNYKTELEQHITPSLIKGTKLALNKIRGTHNLKIAQAYDPWTDEWVELKIVDNSIELPNFSRSIVIKISE